MSNRGMWMVTWGGSKSCQLASYVGNKFWYLTVRTAGNYGLNVLVLHFQMWGVRGGLDGQCSYCCLGQYGKDMAAYLWETVLGP